MANNTVIKVEGLSKQYLLNKNKSAKSDTLFGNFVSSVKNLKNIASKKEMIDFWALNDVSFEIAQGDRVGIIGRNGAGKSTLLKVLSRITPPTKGRVEITGRVASLLEVGTGFHGDLSGRENIYLNGSILGMSKHEIDRKFDEIVDFAEIEKFLDTPVKRYSSGMYVRLAFAVAAHLEPEILIVDEVLAVGDASFQRKCLGKMEQVSENEGRTILFVSHQMDAVQKLCNKAILLQNGELGAIGKIQDVIKTYLESNSSAASSFEIKLPANYNELAGYAYQIRIEDEASGAISEIPMGKKWQVRVKFKISKPVNHFIIACGVTSGLGLSVQTTWSTPQDIEIGDYEVVFLNSEVIYSEGQYKLVIGLTSEHGVIQYNDEAGLINVSDVSNLFYSNTIVNTKSALLLNQMQTVIRKIQ